MVDAWGAAAPVVEAPPGGSGGQLPPPSILPPELPPPSGPYSGGGSFPVGYSGTQGGVGTQVGPPLPPQFPWAGYNQAWDQANRAADQGAAALMGGMGVGSPFWNMLMQGFSSPYGIPPELMAQQRRMLTEQEAGSRANALQRSEQSARAKGFGDSLGAVRAQDQIRTESAANLNDAMNQLAIQDALLSQQRQMGFGGIMGGLYGTDAGLRGAYANLQMGRQFPIQQGQGGPYGGAGGGASGGPWWDQAGKYQTGPQPIDPFVQGPGNAGPGGGWTPQNPRPSW